MTQKSPKKALLTGLSLTRVAMVALVFLISACATVPLTGRKQLSLVSGSQVRSMAASNYQQVLSQSRVITGTAQSQMVQRAGQRISQAVERYLKQQGESELLEGYQWEFNLIDENTVNAWCMPGGKVAFYTGIMPICQDETGVAVVMGHEVAHAVARHGSERMSQGLLQQLGGVALAVAIRDKPQETQALFMAAYGVGTTLGGMLPFSRLHESEADELGLTFMALAGYDPAEAPRFWQRMSQNSQGSPPEFMSTHPSHETRIADLNRLMPNAKRLYEQNKRP